MRSPYKLILNGSVGLIGQYKLSTPSYVAGVNVVIKSDPAPHKRVIKFIPIFEEKAAGIHDISWDFTKNDFTTADGVYSDYEFVVVTHNIVPSWRKLYNNSTLNAGSTVIHAYSLPSCFTKVGDHMIIGRGYDEGSGKVAEYVDVTDDIHKKYNILKFPASGSNFNDTNGNVLYSDSNDTNTFLAITAEGECFVMAIDNITKEEVSFSDPTSVSSFNLAGGRTYPWAIAKSTDVITGICCSNSKLFIAIGALNKIDAYDATTGEFLGSTPGLTGACEIRYNKQWNTVWMLSDLYSPKGFLHTEIDAVTGVLTIVPLLISDFPLNKVTFAINNTTHVLAVVTAGTNQQVKTYNIAPQYPTGNKLIGTCGDLGGMLVTTIMSDLRFLFTDATTPLTGGTPKAALGYDEDNNHLWIMDGGNSRTVIVDSNLNYVDKQTMVGTCYSVSHDYSNSENVFWYWMQVNRTTGEGVRNFKGFLDVNHFTYENYEFFKWIFTLEGRTFSVITTALSMFGYPRFELVELTDTGIIYTGEYINDAFTEYSFGVMASNGDMYRIGAAHYPAQPGETATVYHKPITGLSVGGVPQYGPEVVYKVLSPNTEAGSALDGGQFFGITDDGVIVVGNKGQDINCPEHLQLYRASDGLLFAGSMRNTTEDFYGPKFPTGDHFDMGDDLNNVIAGGFQAFNNFIGAVANGENYKAGKQTTYAFVWTSDGTPIINYGTDRWRAEGPTEQIEESPAISAGNPNSFKFFFDSNDPDIMYCIYPDESRKGALHLMTFTGMTSIRKKTVQIDTAPKDIVREGVYLLDDITFNADVTTNMSHVNSATYKVRSGIKEYDRYKKEVYAWISSAVGNNRTRTRYTPITYSGSLVYYKLKFYICFDGYESPDSVNSRGASFNIKDATDKIIINISLGRVNVTDYYYLRIGDTVIDTFRDEDTVINVISQWQFCTIVVTSFGCLVTYGNYPTILVPYVDNTCDYTTPSKGEWELKTYDTPTSNKAIGIKELEYIEYDTEPSAIVLNGETTDENTIRITFSKGMNSVSALGFDFTDLTILSVNHNPTDDFADFIFVETITIGQVINCTYLDGDSTDSNSLALSNTLSPVSITNNVAPPLTMLGSGFKLLGGFNGSLDSDAFDLPANKTLFVAVKAWSAVSIFSINDTASNFFEYAGEIDFGGALHQIYCIKDTVANAANVISILYGGGNCLNAGVYYGWFDGVKKVSPLDGTPLPSGTASNAPSVNAIFSTTQNKIVTLCMVGSLGDSHTWTLPLGFTTIAEDLSGYVKFGFKEQTAIQTGAILTATKTDSTGDVSMLVANYKL